MIEFVRIDGRFRRIVSKKPSADGFNAVVIIGFRERRSVSARSPGPGWRPVANEKRSWIKREPQQQEMFVKAGDIISSQDWPSGADDHGFKPVDYVECLRPVIAQGVAAAGAVGQRRPPVLVIETVEADIKNAGLAMPTPREFEMLVEDIWEMDHKPKPRRSGGSNVVTGRPPKTAADKAAEVEAARIAEEAEAARRAEEERVAAEAEAARKAEEERVAAEAEAARKAEEERVAAEAEVARKAAESDTKKKGR